jgi:hypothetical protein
LVFTEQTWVTPIFLVATADGIKYITSIKSLADELNIGQFFDVETIGRLAANSKNLDSLLLITTMNFNHINHYLQSHKAAIT